MRKHRRQRGFTLIEMAVTVGILGLLAAMAVYQMGRGKAERDYNAAMRDVTNIMRTARSTGRSRADISVFGAGPVGPVGPSGPSGPSGPPLPAPAPLPALGAAVTVRSTTVDAIGPAQLRLTANFSDGTNQQLEVIDFSTKYPDTVLTIQNFASLSFTFNADGSRSGGSSNQLVLLDPLGKQRILEVSLAGKAELK